MKEFSKYVGLDVHKETIAVSIAEAGAGEVRYFGEIANTPEAVVKLARQLKKGDARLSFCYEAGSGRGAQRTLQWRQAITWGHHQDRQRPCAPGGSRRGVSRASEWGVQLAVDGPRSDSHQFGTDCALSNLSVIGGLRTQPIAVGQAEEAAKPQISISSDPPLPCHNVSNTLGRNADFFSQAILANAHGLKELLQEEFARGDGLKFSHMYLYSVVIHYLYVLSARFRPAKADTPLIIDANAVLPEAVAL